MGLSRLFKVWKKKSYKIVSLAEWGLDGFFDGYPISYLYINAKIISKKSATNIRIFDFSVKTSSDILLYRILLKWCNPWKKDSLGELSIDGATVHTIHISESFDSVSRRIIVRY